MGLIIHPRLILLLLLWSLSSAMQALAETSTTQENTQEVSKPTPLLYTKTVTPKKSEVPAPKNKKDRILPLEAVINGSKSGTWLFLERNGNMYAPSDAFDAWRIQLPADIEPIDFKLDEQQYFPLSAIPGYKFKMDYSTQSVELLFSPEVFAATRLEQEKYKRVPVSPVLPSMFLNYDFNYSNSVFRNSPTMKDLGLITEAGASNSWGVLTSSQVGRNLTNDPNSTNKHGWVRLETTFTKDFPSENRTLRVGDSMTRAGMWGRNIYYGGIQYGTNFALTPGFVHQPIPAVTGISTAPSTVELYVNDVLRQVSTVPTGPFTIDNSPLLTGSGDVRMIVRDILGRETTIEQSFFTSTQLLATGLDDWEIEGGSVRRNMGVYSNNYGPGFISGTWLHGYRDDLTLEGRAEATSDLKVLGFGTAAALPRQILGKAALAISNGQDQNGTLWLLGMDHRTLHSSASFQIQGATYHFHQLGQAAGLLPIKLQTAANWSYTTERIGTFGMGIANLQRYDNTNITTLSGNYSRQFGKQNNLSLTASRALNGSSGTSVGAYLTIPMENNRIVSASANRHNGQQDYYVAASQSPNNENQLGWRALTGSQDNQQHAEGGVYYTGRYGRLSGDASTSTEYNAIRLGAAGGLVLADKKLFATQRINQSYAVAEVAGYKDIGVGLGGNRSSHTDKDGQALIPQLMPYQNNAIRLDPSELPISAEIDTIEQNAVPPWRSAVKVVFPVRGGRGALLKIKLDDGGDAPAGAIVKVEGDDKEFYVARRGEAFVTGLPSSGVIIMDWNGQQCKINVELPPESPDEITRLGPLACKGVTR